MEITTVIIFIKQVISTIMTLLMLMSPAFGGNGTAYAPEKPEEVIMSFSAVSDIHVETNNPEAYKAFTDILYGIKAGERNDAVVFTGDNVMNGQIPENLFFYTAVRSALPADSTFVVSGNHDYGNGEGDFKKFRRNYLINNALYFGNVLEEPYYYRVINGCYMIFLSSESNSVNYSTIGEEQYIWLESVIAEAKAENATVFVFNHHPVDLINGGTDTRLADILSGYNNLLYIHGHIHDQLAADSFYEQYGVKSINLPRSSEVVDYEPGDGIVVEVYENEILVRGRDFITGEWIEGLEYRYPLG